MLSRLLVAALLATSPVADPKPPPADPPPLRVAVKVGELTKLSVPPGEGEPDGEKWAFLWQVPDGLSYQLDSNRREAFVTCGKPGEYRVVVIAARNGDPRPHLCRTEIVVTVGGSSPEPAKPDTSDDVAKAKATYPTLVAAVKAAGEAADADTRKALAGAYAAIAAAIKSGQATTNDAVQRELNAQLAAPVLTTAAVQKLVLAVADAVNTKVKNADKLTPAELRLLYLAVCEGLK